MGLEIFRCEKRSMTLSTNGCARLWNAANQSKPPDPWMGIAGCRSCSIGAFHSTGAVINPLAALADALRLLCPRCFRPSDGLINGTLCRSCHARHGEALRKKDARGREPSLSSRLHTQRIAVSAGHTSPRVITHRAVVAMTEVIVHASKSATEPTSFGKRSVQWRGVPQMEMLL